MLLSVWRYSHLTLAISSFLFLLILSLTGIILTFDPIIEEVNTYSIPKASEQTIQHVIDALGTNYEEIIDLEVTKNHLLKVNGIDTSGNSNTVYVNPITGKSITQLSEQKQIFKWATALHRSLFLKSTGRFIVGITSFLLLLIAISGTVLIVKRQGSLKTFFSKVIKENFYEYYHVIFSRFLLVPIVIIAFTGVYLSLEKFSFLPKSAHKHQVDYDNLTQETQQHKIAVFEQTLLKDVQKLELPFSKDVEDYYVLKLSDKELYIHQYTGETLSQIPINSWKQLYHWSFVLHTGKGSILWSLVLLASSLSIVFFIYSGFNITWQRLQKKGKKVKNKHAKDQAEYVILVGSETGSTFGFATALYNALIDHNKKAYLCTLNDYTLFENIEHLFIITATYGDGEPPKNATQFLSKFKQNPITKNISFSVVGFGSTAYPDFCKYATDVENYLATFSNLTQQLPICKIDKQVFNAFQQWATDWGNIHHLELKLEEPKRKSQKFKVVHKTELDANQTFMITLKPKRKSKIVSGDLIAIQPNQQEQPRLYSIAIIENKIVLSIKKHEYGLCSNYLNNLEQNSTLNANIVENSNFHLPKNTNSLLISNGTGIAPFLGMIANNHNKQHLELFAGFQTFESSIVYDSILNKALENNQLHKVHFAYSRTEKKYVQDLLLENPITVINTLQNNGVVMICGSLKMRDGVLRALDTITQEHLQLSIEHFVDLGLLKTDCY